MSTAIAERRLVDAAARATRDGRVSNVLRLPNAEVELSAKGALPANVTLRLRAGTVLRVRETRDIPCSIDWSEGGVVLADSGVAVRFTGRLRIPLNHHAFDIADGGLYQPAIGAVPELTPENFGASNGGVADDTLACRALIAALEYDATANRAIRGRLLPGVAYRIGGTQDTVAVDWAGVAHYEHVALRVTKSSIRLVGAGAALCSIHYQPADLGTGDLHRYFAVRFEGSGPIVQPGISGVLFRAGGNTSHVKCALDLHDVRDAECHDVHVNNWTDSSNQSVGLRLRGRDAGRISKLKTNCDLPIEIDFNDDDTAGRDANGIPLAFRDNKDLDHWDMSSLDLGVADNRWKAAILVRAGVVFRNITLNELAAVGGGFVCVDRLDSGGVAFAGSAIAPRRASNHLRIVQGRTEGLLSGAGHAGIRIERHRNGRLRELQLASYLLGEGRDNRRSEATGAATNTGVVWDGLVATGVQRLAIGGDVRYGGTGTPLTVDPECRIAWTQDADGRPVAEMVPSDRNRRMPETESHWTFIAAHESPVVALQHWWLMGGTVQDADIDDQQSVGTDIDLQTTGSPSPTYKALVDGWHGYTLRFTETSNQKARLNSTIAAVDPSAGSCAGLAIWTIDNAWVPSAGGAGTLCDLLNLGGTNQGPLLRFDPAGSGRLFLRADTTDGALSTRSYNDGVAFAAFLAINHSAATIRCWLRKFTGESEIITVAFTAAVGNAVNKGFGPYTAGVYSPLGNLHMAGHGGGAAAEQDGYGLLGALGWRA